MAKINSVFGSYADKLQVVIDRSLDKFAPTWFEDYFDFGVPQQSLNFVTVIGRSRIEAAASIVARGSSAPLRSRAGLDKLSGEIPPILQKFAMREEDYRNYLTIQSLAVSDETKRKMLLDLLFGDVKKTGDALMKRLDIMCLQAVSTGKISADVTNNPDGIVLASDLDLLMPSTNKTNAAVAWATAATATPIKDIETAVSYQSNRGVAIGKVLMTPTAWGLFRATTEVKDYFGAFLGKSNNKVLPTLNAVDEFMTEHRLPVIEIVDKSIGIEKDGVISTIRPFADANVALVPAGKLGTIHNALAMEEFMPVAKVSYGKFKNGLISKWQENEPWAEFTKGELNAFPGLDAIDQIHLISTTVAF
jgi:hypothetical protein